MEKVFNYVISFSWTDLWNALTAVPTEYYLFGWAALVVLWILWPAKVRYTHPATSTTDHLMRINAELSEQLNMARQDTAAQHEATVHALVTMNKDSLHYLTQLVDKRYDDDCEEE